MKEEAKWERRYQCREHRNSEDVLHHRLDVENVCDWLGNFLGVDSACLPFQGLVGIRAGFYLNGFIILNYQWPLYHVPPSSLITKPCPFFIWNVFLSSISSFLFPLLSPLN